MGAVKMTNRDLDDVRLARALLETGEAERLRESANLTRAEIATHIGCTWDAVALWERGERVPRTPQALKLGQLLRRLRTEVAS